MFARLIVCLILAFASFGAQAQHRWTLTNISNQTLKFDTFDPARGSWMQQTIYPHQPATYTMGGEAGKFRISTQGRGFVEYQVKTGGAYTLGWDAAKGVWDLKLASGGQGVKPGATAGTGITGLWRSSTGSSIQLRAEGNQVFVTVIDKAGKRHQASGRWLRPGQVFDYSLAEFPGVATGTVVSPTQISVSYNGTVSIWQKGP